MHSNSSVHIGVRQLQQPSSVQFICCEHALTIACKTIVDELHGRSGITEIDRNASCVHSSIDVEMFAGDERGTAGSQKCNRSCRILRLADSSQRKDFLLITRHDIIVCYRKQAKND